MLLTTEQKKDCRKELLKVFDNDRNAFSLSFLTYKRAYSRILDKEIKVNPYTFINLNYSPYNKITYEQHEQVNTILKKYYINPLPQYARI